MDFSLSDEQLELRNLARQILEDQTSNEHLRDVEAGEERFDPKLWGDLAEAGLLGLAMSEDHGGMALGYESLCLLVEEVGRTVAPAPVVPVLVSGALSIERFGTDEQKQRLLPGVVNGETMVTAAFIEPLNEDPLRPLATAKEEGEGVVLDGVKTCVPFANRAQRVLVAAQCDGGVGLYLVDPNASGVRLERQQSTAGEPQFEMHLEAVAVTAQDVLAPPSDGARALQWIVDRTSAANCAMALGVVDRMTRMTAEYTAEREQFGVKIATFQAVGQRAANCYIDTECLRLLTQQAVSLLNDEREASEELTIAQIWVGDVGHRVSHAAQHLHGGIGVDRDYPLFRYCLWAKQLELAMGGTAQLTAKLGEGIAREFSANA